MPEIDPLVLSYSHLATFPRADEALHMLKRIASLVKPLMRARGWTVGRLTEFFPEQAGLLGLNVDRGHKICLRLRHPADRNQFLPFESVADTMLHELAHIQFGPHDAKFHALWNQLRDEQFSLTLKGYTGEGFLSEGHRLGGRTIPMDEARRLARIEIQRQRSISANTPRRLGGAAPRPGQDIHQVMGDAAQRRNSVLQGCANTTRTQGEIIEIADTAIRNGFKTKAEEETANDAAIAQALWEIVQEEEMAKKGSAYVPPSTAYSRGWGASTPHAGLALAMQQPLLRPKPQCDMSGSWKCRVCTLVNPATFLCCDVCGAERGRASAPRSQTVIDLTTDSPNKIRSKKPSSKDKDKDKDKIRKKEKESRHVPPQLTVPGPTTWKCHVCGRKREKHWWSCDLCGSVKLSSG